MAELEWVNRAHAGDSDAFTEIYNEFFPRVYAFTLKRTGNPAEAEDLAQETFVRAFNAIGSYNPRYKFSSWIFKIANNLTIDHLRKKRLDTVSIDGSPNATTAAEREGTRLIVEDTGERPDGYVESMELGSQIESAIGELRPEYRTVVLLRHVEGYSYDEIAEIMGIPLGTVKTYLHRARTELKEALAHVAN